MEAVLLGDYETSSFVSIPTPNAFLFGNSENASEVLRNSTYERLFRALCIFTQQGCNDIILCALGCATHSNSPHMVAEVFDDLLSHTFKNHFDRVVFAINPKKPAIYDAFASVLHK